MARVGSPSTDRWFAWPIRVKRLSGSIPSPAAVAYLNP